MHQKENNVVIGKNNVLVQNVIKKDQKFANGQDLFIINNSNISINIRNVEQIKKEEDYSNVNKKLFV